MTSDIFACFELTIIVGTVFRMFVGFFVFTRSLVRTGVTENFGDGKEEDSLVGVRYVNVLGQPANSN